MFILVVQKRSGLEQIACNLNIYWSAWNTNTGKSTCDRWDDRNKGIMAEWRRWVLSVSFKKLNK
jgi:hypothetical protein